MKTYLYFLFDLLFKQKRTVLIKNVINQQTYFINLFLEKIEYDEKRFGYKLTSSISFLRFFLNVFNKNISSIYQLKRSTNYFDFYMLMTASICKFVLYFFRSQFENNTMIVLLHIKIQIIKYSRKISRVLKWDKIIVNNH